MSDIIPETREIVPLLAIILSGKSSAMLMQAFLIPSPILSRWTAQGILFPHRRPSKEEMISVGSEEGRTGEHCSFDAECCEIPKLRADALKGRGDGIQ